MKYQTTLRRLSRAAAAAALYVMLTMLSRVFGIDSGMIQCRFSEALCVLPLFAPEMAGGITVGCLLANLFLGAPWQDVVFGTLATLLGALGALALRRLRGKTRILATLPTVIANGLIIPVVLKVAYGLEDAWWFLAITVTAGELISATVFGALLLPVFDRLPFLKRDNRG